MRIVVLVKPVPVVGTERLDAELWTDRGTLELNGNDEYMLERALKLTEADGGEVSMLAMAPGRRCGCPAQGPCHRGHPRLPRR